MLSIGPFSTCYDGVVTHSLAKSSPEGSLPYSVWIIYDACARLGLPRRFLHRHLVVLRVGDYLESSHRSP